MKLAILAVASAAALAACAGAGSPDAGGAESGKSVDQGVAAPTPSDVAVRLSAADKGKSVSVKVGDKLAVELVGVPTAGNIWAAAETPPFLVRRRHVRRADVEGAAAAGLRRRQPLGSARLQSGKGGDRNAEAGAEAALGIR